MTLTKASGLGLRFLPDFTFTVHLFNVQISATTQVQAGGGQERRPDSLFFFQRTYIGGLSCCERKIILVRLLHFVFNIPCQQRSSDSRSSQQHSQYNHSICTLQYLYTIQMNAYLAARVSTQTTLPTCFKFSFHAFKLTSDPRIYAATSSDRPFFRRNINNSTETFACP